MVYPAEANLNIHTVAEATHMFLPGAGQHYAPDAYRIGMPALGRGLVWLTQTVHPSWVAAGMDAGFFALGSWAFYKVVSSGWNDDAMPRRLATAVYLLLIQFPLQWVLPWRRLETMAVTAYLAVGLWCLQKAQWRRKWSVVLLGATALQTSVRTDVPLVFGLSIMAAAIAGRTDMLGSRRATFATGLGVASLAAGVQLFLQRVVFPHLSYQPGVPVLQFGYNLHGHNLAVLAIALFPFAAFFALRSRQWMAWQGFSVVVAIASVLYLMLWFAVGIVAEVRLFVPFLFALSVVVARAVGERFARNAA